MDEEYYHQTSRDATGDIDQYHDMAVFLLFTKGTSRTLKINGKNKISSYILDGSDSVAHKRYHQIFLVVR